MGLNRLIFIKKIESITKFLKKTKRIAGSEIKKNAPVFNDVFERAKKYFLHTSMKSHNSRTQM